MTSLAPNGPLLLIVDDDPEMRAMLRDALTRVGFRIEEAGSGTELLQLAPRTEPAAIILDDEMPGPRGLEVLPTLRRCCPDVPVILITGFGNPRTRELALGLGAAAYLDKPFGMGGLLDTVRGALAHRHSPPRDPRQPVPRKLDDAPGPLRGLTVLVVDDHAAIRQSLGDLLRLDRARVLLAEDGRRALEVLAREEPDVILCDLQMPRMDGFGLIRRIRSDPRRAGLFVVALTGLSGDEERQRTRQAGFDGHVAKPVDYLELRRYICLRGHWARRCRRRPWSDLPARSGCGAGGRRAG
jgi:CheY-like chemotaxis protein